MPTTDSLDRAGAAIATLARTIPDDMWSAATPCDGWTVRQLVGHVVAGCEIAALLAAGGSRDEAIALLSVDHLGDDPFGALDRALERQQIAFEQPEVGVVVFHHPAGDMPGSVVLNFRLGDLLVHQWDLARAIGADETLDPILVQDVWNAIEPMVPMMATSGVFGTGPSGNVGTDAPLQVRLLDAMGRRP